MSLNKYRYVPAFSRSLSSLLASGIPVLTALRSVEDQAGTRSFRAVISNICVRMEGGDTLSAALTAFPQLFDARYCGMIKAAESTGKMPEALTGLADIMDGELQTRRRIRRAMIYPAIVLTMGLGVSLFLVLFVLPSIKDAFGSLDADLPAPARFLMNLAAWLRTYGILVLLGVVAMIVLVKLAESLPAFRYARDRIRLALPVFGKLNRRIAAARFGRAYAELLQSGVPALQALALAADATDNIFVRTRLLNAAADMEQGKPLSEVLEPLRLFPRAFLEILRSGEKSGQTDTMLNNVSTALEQETAAMLDSLTTLIYPVVIVLLGIVVGGIALSLLLPLFKLPEVIGQ